ncbi:hypothetical protein CLV59_1108 [Chitinophaga dinghuensis]|uniref:Uncharacterized protein n=1 Tax=Chitinophaga dinghuensis TaxID=1539050 RepID=A0A327VKE2_9BACT|nr:hypothetical protein CLV59_1108 [Chitinophaga dinghuensis]
MNKFDDENFLLSQKHKKTEELINWKCEFLIYQLFCSSCGGLSLGIGEILRQWVYCIINIFGNNYFGRHVSPEIIILL